MKRPFGCACLFFLLLILVFYACFPPALPDYSPLQGRKVYVNGRVISQKYQEVNGELCVVYTLGEVRLQKNSEANSDYFSDKNNFLRDTKDHTQNTRSNSQKTEDDLQSNQENARNIQTDFDTEYKHKKIDCYADVEYPEVYIGSRVWVRGTFLVYTAPENPGQFDSQLYYHIRGAGGSLEEAELIWSDGKQNILDQTLWEWKQYFLEKMDAHFTGRYGGVMKTILLGDKSGLDQELKVLFQEGGILHILTISGLHISMLGMNGFRLLRKAGFSKKLSAVVGIILVLLYGAMIGTQAATFRAICMFSMQMAAILLGRTYDRLTGMAVAAVLLLLEQPMYVFYSGFLLSFGAVVGVTVLTPLVEQLCKDKGKLVVWFGKLFGGGIGILLASFPIQLYYYYEYPLYSMLVNIIVLPFLPYIVGFGAVVLALPEAAAIVITPFVYGAELLLWGFEWVCRKSQTLPYHSMVFGAPEWWQILIYYGCLLLVVWGILHKHKISSRLGRFQMLQWVFWAVILCTAAGVVLWRPVRGVTCSFLSVGQGDCTIVRYGKETYVIDCGSTGKRNVGTRILLPCLKYYGISEVNGVFLSHGDEDHINGIMQWLEEYEHSHVRMGMLLLPALEKEVLAEEFAEILEWAGDWEIPIVTIGAGDRLDLGDLTIEVLHPVKNSIDTEDANGYSQVLYFSYKGQGMLFTGDIGAEQEALLTKELDGRQITLLKAAHHGSRYSSSESFLEICSPEHAVLSYGVGNRYGHPHKETVARMECVGINIWYTGRQGAIMAELDQEMKIYGYKK